MTSEAIGDFIDALPSARERVLMSELAQDLQDLAERFAELEEWIGSTDEFGTISAWGQGELRATRLLVEQLCALTEPMSMLPTWEEPPDAPVDHAARVAERVLGFSDLAGELFRRHAPSLDEASQVRLKKLTANVVGQLFTAVLRQIWRKWPELEPLQMRG
jgi:hypothetical protein